MKKDLEKKIILPETYQKPKKRLRQVPMQSVKREYYFKLFEERGGKRIGFSKQRRLDIELMLLIACNKLMPDDPQYMYERLKRQKDRFKKGIDITGVVTRPFKPAISEYARTDHLDEM